MTDEPTSGARLPEALAEIERLRARILELEAEQAITHGTIARTYGTQAPPPVDMPTVYSHNVKPSAPPHNE